MKNAGLDPKQYTPGAILSGISGAKAQLRDPAAYRANVGSYFEEVTLRAYEEYQRMLRANQAVDFDDLLLLTHGLFATHSDVLDRYQQRYRHLMVDEFQDTNIAQYELAKQLAGKWRNIAVVGDPGPVHLLMAARGHPQHPEFSQRFPRCRDGPPRGELPLLRQHPLSCGKRD